MRYEQMSKDRISSRFPFLFLFLSSLLWLKSGKREKAMIAEHERACTDKIAKLEESLKKKKQVRKSN